jgi:hypothetical protein
VHSFDVRFGDSVSLENWKDIWLVAEPVPDDIYNNESHTGGVLVLYALQPEVGDDTLFKRLRTYAERYLYGNARQRTSSLLQKRLAARIYNPFSMPGCSVQQCPICLNDMVFGFRLALLF